jgi:hypothetical protein
MVKARVRQAATRFDAYSGVRAIYTVADSTTSLDLSALSGVDEVVIRRLDPTTDAESVVGTFATTSTIELEHPERQRRHGLDVPRRAGVSARRSTPSL